MKETQFRILINVLMLIAQAINRGKKDKTFTNGLNGFNDLVDRYNKECGK